MHPKIFNEFNKLCLNLNNISAVLEVGAVPKRNSLLYLPALDGVANKTGINLDGPYDYSGASIVKGNANEMGQFEDASFDLVLCNSMLEHDLFFWKTISEMRRVLKPGGVMIIGVPGYKGTNKMRSTIKKKKRKSLIRKFVHNEYVNMAVNSTITFRVHDAPGDYYRFSPQTFHDLFYNGFANVRIYPIMIPPRIIGYGMKPEAD